MRIAYNSKIIKLDNVFWLLKSENGFTNCLELTDFPEKEKLSLEYNTKKEMILFIAKLILFSEEITIYEIEKELERISEENYDLEEYEDGQIKNILNNPIIDGYKIADDNGEDSFYRDTYKLIERLIENGYINNLAGGDEGTFISTKKHFLQQDLVNVNWFCEEYNIKNPIPKKINKPFVKWYENHQTGRIEYHGVFNKQELIKELKNGHDGGYNFD